MFSFLIFLVAKIVLISLLDDRDLNAPTLASKLKVIFLLMPRGILLEEIGIKNNLLKNNTC